MGVPHFKEMRGSLHDGCSSSLRNEVKFDRENTGKLTSAILRHQQW